MRMANPDDGNLFDDPEVDDERDEAPRVEDFDPGLDRDEYDERRDRLDDDDFVDNEVDDYEELKRDVPHPAAGVR